MGLGRGIDFVQLSNGEYEMVDILQVDSRSSIRRYETDSTGQWRQVESISLPSPDSGALLTGVVSPSYFRFDGFPRKHGIGFTVCATVPDERFDFETEAQTSLFERVAYFRAAKRKVAPFDWFTSEYHLLESDLVRSGRMTEFTDTTEGADLGHAIVPATSQDSTQCYRWLRMRTTGNPPVGFINSRTPPLIISSAVACGLRTPDGRAVVLVGDMNSRDGLASLHGRTGSSWPQVATFGPLKFAVMTYNQPFQGLSIIGNSLGKLVYLFVDQSTIDRGVVADFAESSFQVIDTIEDFAMGGLLLNKQGNLQCVVQDSNGNPTFYLRNSATGQWSRGWVPQP